MLQDFFLGSIKIHILYHASREPVYGMALMEELGRHGYRIGPGTLYPILHSLEQDGVLSSTRQLIQGRTRRYYSITTQGRVVLDDARRRVRELMNEIFEEDDDHGSAGSG